MASTPDWRLLSEIWLSSPLHHILPDYLERQSAIANAIRSAVVAVRGRSVEGFLEGCNAFGSRSGWAPTLTSPSPTTQPLAGAIATSMWRQTKPV